MEAGGFPDRLSARTPRPCVRVFNSSHKDAVHGNPVRASFGNCQVRRERSEGSISETDKPQLSEPTLTRLDDTPVSC